MASVTGTELAVVGLTIVGAGAAAIGEFGSGKTKSVARVVSVSVSASLAVVAIYEVVRQANARALQSSSGGTVPGAGST